MPEPISALLLPEAANNRHGLVFTHQIAYLSKSDVPNIYHVGVPYSVNNPWQSASGGVDFDQKRAILAAIGEGIERYCAAIAQLPLKNKHEVDKQFLVDATEWTLFSNAQRSDNNFPFSNIYSEKCLYTNVFDLPTNQEYWVPQPLVVLRDDFETGIPTSSGLAAGPSGIQALLRAIEELIERDALMSTWLHCLAGRRIKLPTQYETEIQQLAGEVYAFDITPIYSPFPVVIVAGGIPKRGKFRYSLGVACRETLEQAVQKAYLEWCQGVFFAGIYPKYVDVNNLKSASDVKTFDDHAIYYTLHPTEWSKLPIFQNLKPIFKPSTFGQKLSAADAVALLVARLNRQGIKIYYRDLTSIDALQAGVRVVRVLSPQLIPINSHHAWPFMGGTAPDISLRYRWAKSESKFPSPYPHPLG